MSVTVLPRRGVAGPDPEPAVVRFVRTWSAGPPPPPPAPVHRRPAATPERLQAAARAALAHYPGPVGELLQRELLAYGEIGVRFAGPTLIGRLVRYLLDDAAPTGEGTGP